MSSISYWNSLSYNEKLYFVIQLATEAKRLNDYKTSILVMKADTNNDSAFMDLFIKALRLVFKDETITAA